MVSSAFGKLEVRRHLISGDDCAIAGEATAATAAPGAETFKKSRRFIKPSPYWDVSQIYVSISSRRGDCRVSRRCSGGRSLTRKFGPGIRDKGMTALSKRKSNTPENAPQAAAITLCS